MHYIAPEYLLKYGSKRLKYFFDYQDLRELIKLGECETVEFKLKAKHPEKIVREIVAFANTKGGKLLLGVDDDGQIKGLKFAIDEEIALVSAIEKLCLPAIDYDLYQTTLPDGREVLIFDIEPSDTVHSVAEIPSVSKKTTYVRVKDRSIQASAEMRQILKAKHSGKQKAFQFGPKEQFLMHFLEENQSITLEQFSKLGKVPMWLASKILVNLCLSNVIQIFPGESFDTYKRK